MDSPGHAAVTDGPATAGQGGWFSPLSMRLVTYHLGRLLTYLTMGLVVGSAAMVVDSGGASLGLSSFAARVAGVLLVVFGMYQLLAHYQVLRYRLPHGTWHLKIVPWITGFRRHLQGMPPAVRSLAMGSMTTLLPCGWLYLFALVAGGTGRPVASMLVMFAFWLGTIPALTAVVRGFTSLRPALLPWLPTVTAVVLVATGIYTATGRAATDLSPLTERAAALSNAAGKAAPVNAAGHSSDSFSASARVLQLKSEPMPCCIKE